MLLELATWVAAGSTFAIFVVTVGFGFYTLRASWRAFTQSVAAMQLSARIGVENQTSNAILSFSQRYDELYKFRADISALEARLKREAEGSVERGFIDTELKDATKMFYRRYWGLQADQLNHWLRGYVDPDTICNWLLSAAFHLKRDEKVGGLPYQQGWALVKDQHEQTNHNLFVFAKSMLPEAGYLDEHPNQTLARIIVLLQRMEINEDRYIRMSSSNYQHRNRMDDYIPTLRTELINAVETTKRQMVV